MNNNFILVIWVLRMVTYGKWRTEMQKFIEKKNHPNIDFFRNKKEEAFIFTANLLFVNRLRRRFV